MLPRRHRGQHSCQTPKEVVDAVRTLAYTCTDEVIAGALNRNHLLTAHGNRWTRELVTSLRSKHQIPRYKPLDEKSSDWMNLTKAAQFLSISSTALRLASRSALGAFCRRVCSRLEPAILVVKISTLEREEAELSFDLPKLRNLHNG
jgi:hypothetical protein